MSGTFRKEYRPLTGGEKTVINDVKNTAEQFEDYIEGEQNYLDATGTVGSGEKRRALALAKTKLEESVMWFTKAVTG